MEGRTSMFYELVYFRWKAGHPCPMDLFTLDRRQDKTIFSYELKLLSGN
jgi:hypothetical protein